MIPKLYKVISGKYVDDTLNYLLSHQGGGVSVNTFTQDIVLTGNTIPLDTGFYNTGNFGLFIGSQTPQNLIFGAGEIIYVDKDTLTIIGSLVSISYDLIDSVWTIQDNQKIENEVTNNRDKIPTSQAVYNGLATKQNTLTAGSGISIVGNVISATGGGGGVSVTNLTQDVVLEANSSTTGLSTGFYNTNGYGVYYHSATIGNLIYGNGIFYYDEAELTFIDSYNITNYSVGDSDWVVTNNASVESTLTNSTIHVPNSYAVSQALGNKQETLTAGAGIEINNNVISTNLLSFQEKIINQTLSTKNGNKWENWGTAHTTNIIPAGKYMLIVSYQVTGNNANGACTMKTLIDNKEVTGGARSSIYLTGSSIYTGTGFSLVNFETDSAHTLLFQGYGTTSWKDGTNVIANFIRIGDYESE